MGARDVGAIEVAAALVVDTASNNPAAGLTLAEAIADTGSGGVIFFDSSLAGATLTPDAADLVVAKSIALDASSLNQPVNITPVGGNFRVTVNWTLTLRNVRIRGATSPLLVDGGASLTAIDSHFTKSTGGAVEAEPSGRLVFVRCSLKDNTRIGDGGAIAMGLDATMEIIDCQLSGNRANNGGAISCSSLAVLEFTRCLFTQNEAGGQAGGILVSGGNLRCDNVTIAENRSRGAGGAIADNPSLPSNMSFAFTTITDNSSDTGTVGLRLGRTFAEFHYTYVGNNENSTSGLNNAALTANSSIISLGRNLEDATQMGFTGAGDTQNLVAGGQPAALADNSGYVRTCAANTQTPRSNGFAAAKFFSFYDARGFCRSVFISAASGTEYYDQLNAGAHQWRGDEGDRDHDGLSDYWEHRNCTDVLNDDAGEDPDGDGQSNAFEFAAFTDPHNKSSALSLTGMEMIDATRARVSWRSLPGLLYEIEGTTDLETWTDLAPSMPATSGALTTTTIVDLPPGENDRYFLRATLP